MPWRNHQTAEIANSAAIRRLLNQALVKNPENGMLHTKLAYVFLDKYDFAAAAFHFESAASLTVLSSADCARLARCYNMLERPNDALRVLEDLFDPQFERGAAYLKLGRGLAAEAELRAVLAEEPNDHRACRLLCRLLRVNDRIRDLLELCEQLGSSGAKNAQHLFNWGWALALIGDTRRASRLLLETDRICEGGLESPAGFSDIESFNEALAAEILANDNRLSDFPEADEANRGSSRVENLYAGSNPALIRLLLDAMLVHAQAYGFSKRRGFDPWPRARPAQAHLKAWGLLQRGDDHEAWHIHPAGWLSGVYYVRIPRSVTEAGTGPGSIEFGPPAGLAKVMPGAAQTWRYAPRPGRFLLAPSHYPHRTIPSGKDEDRISVAFDIVPDGKGGPLHSSE